MDRDTDEWYVDDAELAARVGDFIGDAIEAGDAGLIVAPQQRRVQIEEQLRMRRSCRRAMSTAPGVFRALDASGVLADFMHGEWPDTQRFVAFFGHAIDTASDDGRRCVRVYCEIATALADAGKHDAAVRLGQLWSTLTEQRAFSLLRACTAQNAAGTHGTTLIHGREHGYLAASVKLRPGPPAHLDSRAVSAPAGL